MKLRPISFILLSLPGMGVLAYAEPALGDTRDKIEAELGKPSVTRRPSDSVEISRYARGMVTYGNGVATKINVISRAEFEVRQKRAEEEAAAAEAARAARAEQDEIGRGELIRSISYRSANSKDKFMLMDRFLAEHPGASTAEVRMLTPLVRSKIEMYSKLIAQAQTEAKFFEERQRELSSNYNYTSARAREIDSLSEQVSRSRQVAYEYGEKLNDELSKAFRIIQEFEIAPRPAPAPVDLNVPAKRLPRPERKELQY